MIWYEILNLRIISTATPKRRKKNQAWPKAIIPADKTNNLYRPTADEYNKLLTENISKSYEKNLINLH